VAKIETKAAEPVAVPGIRESLAALETTASHAATAATRGQTIGSLVHRADAHLVDAINALRELDSACGGSDGVRDLIARLD
jgi:hypothetical protein